MNQELYTQLVRPAAAMLARVHVAVHRASGGRLGCRWRGGEVALLSTTGRRTGTRRTTPVVCLREGRNMVVVASNGGSDRAPDWWLNLQDRPWASVEIGGHVVAVTAVEASNELQAQLVERFEGAFPCFRGYRARTSRAIPIVVLSPSSRRLAM